ncbi:PREDICTED: uncharacterized protein LOC106103714 isoform X2 [Papilio polytes]|uniref:uncharacterized protein LOC106103714 isoform X2 n=1 Tax=Papilio polytes TaxID=76194 RepID=UPI000675DD10|nr:PREDICTED: uncharacterized protein LOC106103714 isoform X2 [Papilio polytes]
MTNTRKLKVWVCLFCMATSLAAPAPRAPLELDIIDMAAISRMTPQQLEVLAEGLAAEEIMRTKRSSAQALSAVASKAASGIQSKLGLLGQASAGAASFISSASSKSEHGEGHGYSYEPHDEKVDYWGLKKSILYTLFQAVKAITGGVTILKGQLIKGGGALAASLGRVISSKGDVVSNLGKKIVSSAALSHKKPAAVVYGAPPTAHVEYGPPPSAYAAPTAPAHYPHTSSALAAPTGFAAHKYPSHIDGRGKLAGVHAGVVILAPLGDAAHGETHQHSVGHTPLEPPPSILNTVYTAVKDVFTSASPSLQSSEPQHLAIPPPPLPDFKPMTWGAVDSYGEPASTDAYLDYDPRNPQPPFAHATSKHSIVPSLYKKEGLTPAKIQKINRNLSKLAAYMNNNVQRSLDDAPQFNKDRFEEILMKTGKAFLPTPTSDNDVGVLPAELLPDLDLTTTTTTTARTTTDSDANRRTDVKFFLRGNKIVQV